MQSGKRVPTPLLRASDNFTTWSEKLESALMLFQPEPLDHFLARDQDVMRDKEFKQDKLSLPTIKLNVHDS
jgi:hypothetical protein